MATTFYNLGKTEILAGTVDLVNDDIRVLLVSATYTPNPDSDFVSAITNEVAGTNYVRKVLASKTVTKSDAADVAIFDAADVVWTALGVCSPARAIIYKFNASDAAALLISCHDLTSPPVANGGDYTLIWSASGIIRL